MPDYLPHTSDEVVDMLDFLGLSSLEELFAHVPAALRAGRSVFICGGPGEGKSMLARSVGVALWEEGSLLGGVFEVDLTGDPWG